MEIICPQCNFTRIIPDEKIPARAEIATCPKCKHKFRFRELTEGIATDATVDAETGPDNTSVPKQSSEKEPQPSLTHNKPETKQDNGEEFWDKLAALGQPHQDKQHRTSPSGDASTFAEIDVPWEHLDKYGFFPGLWETIKRAMLQPAAFFRSMPVGNGQIKPLIFYLLIAEFQIVMQLLWDMTGVGANATSEAGLAGISAVMLLVVYPLLLIMMLYLMAALVHACLHLVGVATRGFEGTFRALTYGSAPMVMVLVPMIGPLIGAIWSLIVTFLGYKHIHRSTTGKVLLAMLLPLIPFGLLLILVLTMAQRNGAMTF
ncbi:MAG TPA: hypothetical protein ENN39_02015 [Desulfonatronum sp.]|nr:hypothetical protein [Desulfonatronum sp.]